MSHRHSSCWTLATQAPYSFDVRHFSVRTITMAINPAEPNVYFAKFWSELSSIMSPGKVVGKFHGKAITIKSVNRSHITISSPGSGGIVEIQQNSFKRVYENWRNYRYEELSSSNPQDVLDIISIIDHVIHTWVRREKKIDLIEKARHAGIPDGVFFVVNYNNHGRFIGPKPVGEIVSTIDVFPYENQEKLKEYELLAFSLYRYANELCAKYYDKGYDPRKWLENRFPQFSQKVYRSVISRANFMAIK